MMWNNLLQLDFAHPWFLFLLLLLFAYVILRRHDEESMHNAGILRLFQLRNLTASRRGVSDAHWLFAERYDCRL